MKYQFALILFTLLAFVLANRASGTGLAFALTAALIQRNPAQNLYEVAKLVFEKGVEDIEKAVTEGLGKLKSDVDGMFQKANEQTKNSVDGVEKALKTEIENAVKKVNELEQKAGKLDPEVQKQLDAIQIEMKKSGNHQQAQKSFADVFTEMFKKSEKDAKGVGDSFSAKHDFEIDTKAVVMETTSLTGDVIAADRRPGIVFAPTRKVHMRDLLFRGTTTSSDKWEYTQESGYNDGTATVAEGAAIPKSDLTLSQARTYVKKIAAGMDVSVDIMEDVPGLLSYITGRLKTKYDYKEDNQLLFGAGGTGATDILGVYQAATAFAGGGVKPTNNANFWDVLAVAATQLAINEYMGNAAVVSIQDFAAMGLTKDTQGRYILPIMLQGNQVQQQVFGLNILPTTAMPANSWLVGDFENSAEIVDRRLVNILFSNENKDNFDRDLMTIKLTARLALPIYYTGGFVKGTFTGTGGAVAAIS